MYRKDLNNVNKETELPKQVAVKERSTSKEDSLPRWGQLLLTQINYKHVI